MKKVIFIFVMAFAAIGLMVASVYAQGISGVPPVINQPTTNPADQAKKAAEAAQLTGDQAVKQVLQKKDESIKQQPTVDTQGAAAGVQSKAKAGKNKLKIKKGKLGTGCPCASDGKNMGAMGAAMAGKCACGEQGGSQLSPSGGK